MTESTSGSMCPMAAMCKGMTDKPISGLVILILALVFVTFGVAILIAPQILAWLVGIVLVVVGVAILIFGRFMRKFSERS